METEKKSKNFTITVKIVPVSGSQTYVFRKKLKFTFP